MSEIKKIIYGKKSMKEGQLIFVKEEDFHGSPYYYKTTEIAIKEKQRIEKTSLRGKSFTELFAYEDISMWWFFHQVFFFKLQKNLNFIIEFVKFIEETNPEVIIIENDYNMVDIIKQICLKEKILFKYSSFSYFKYKIEKHVKQYIRGFIRKIRLKKRAKLRINNHTRQYLRKFDSIPPLNDKIIFASPMTYRRHLFNLDKGVSETGEFLVQDIVNLLKSKQDIIGISIEHSIPGHTDNVLSERLNSEIKWLPEETLLVDHNKCDKHKEFLKKYKKLISTKEFHKLFQFNDILLWDHLKDDFIQMTYAPYFSYWLNLMDSLSTIFATKRPKAIFLISEIDAPALAFINAAKKYKIKTIGIQQGIIQDQGPVGYLHNTYLSSNSYGYPYPEALLIFGEFTRQVLIRNGYPPERLVKFGNPIYFNLNEIEQTLNNKSLYKKYNIDINQKVILFTTTKMQEDYESSSIRNYDTQIWRYLLETFANDDKFVIILKPHPQENTRVYEKILQEHKPSNARIIQENLFELLYISSVVVSNHSTVIMDAICLKKPVIEVKWDYVEDRFLRFDKAGVVITSKLNQLLENIHKILDNEETKNILLKNRIEFIKDHFNIPIEKSELEKILEKVLV